MKTAILEAPLSRIIEVAGIQGAVVLKITPAGLSFRLKHSQKEVSATWDRAIAICDIDYPHVPKYLVGEPFTFLQTVALEMAKRRKGKVSTVKLLLAHVQSTQLDTGEAHP